MWREWRWKEVLSLEVGYKIVIDHVDVVFHILGHGGKFSHIWINHSYLELQIVQAMHNLL